MSNWKVVQKHQTGSDVWDLYLSSFDNINNIFRDPNSSVYNCNHCNNFIRRYGNIVSIDENFKIMTLFDFEIEGEYKIAVERMGAELRNSRIKDIFFETYEELNKLPYESCKKNQETFKLGISKNFKQYNREEVLKYGAVEEGKTYEFNHFNLVLPKQFVDQSGKSVEAIQAEYRDAKNVFQRALYEIPLDTLQLVKDLINQGSLLDGQTHLFKVDQMIVFKQQLDKLKSVVASDNWCWVKSYKLPIAKFKNELIGVLCSELAEGVELNKACESWNKRVDPANYMKAVAPITKKQIEEAKKFVEENGYVESFNRRLANIDDIKVSEILHVNAGKGEIKEVSIFDSVKSTSTRHKRSEFDKVEEVSIEKFMKDILPGCTSVEAFLTNNMEGNMVSLTTANNPDSKPIFKWSNNYSWTYNGNLAGKSQIKEAVKNAGGKVEGVLRFFIIWNEDGRDILDFDAHAQESSGEHIYYGSFKNHQTYQSGMLDVDMIRPDGLGVENIIWSDKSKMKSGTTKFWIHNYDRRNNKGFKAEIEFDGEIYVYEHKSTVIGSLPIAEVTLKKWRILYCTQNTSY